MTVLDDVSLAIGRLQSQVESLATEVRVGTLASKETAEDVRHLRAMLTPLKADVDGMRPTVERLEGWRQRAVGITLALSLIGSALGSEAIRGLRGWFS